MSRAGSIVSIHDIFSIQIICLLLQDQPYQLPIRHGASASDPKENLPYLLY